MDKEYIETGIEGLTVYKNKVFMDARGALLQLAPDVAENPHFAGGIGNLCAGIAVGKEPRGAHYHHNAQKDIWGISGTGLCYFLDMRSHSPTQGKSFACIVGFAAEEVELSFAGIPRFFTQKEKWIAHIRISPGIYDLIWPVGNNPFIFVESKTTKYDESDYIRIAPDALEEVRIFKRAHGLVS